MRIIASRTEILDLLNVPEDAKLVLEDEVIPVVHHNDIGCIKTLRQMFPKLGLKECKDIFEMARDFNDNKVHFGYNPSSQSTSFYRTTNGR